MNGKIPKNSVSRFSHRATLYDQFRPNYPSELVAFLRECIASDSGKTVADIAAGTGIFTEQIAQWGNAVFVVEPNGSMRRLARRRLNGFKNCVFVNGTAESTGLPDQSVDLVVSA